MPHQPKHSRISRETILTLHSLVMDKIVEVKGQFRTVPVYTRGSNMAPPAREVPQLMDEWLAWLYGKGLAYEPIMRAAIALHDFEGVHPLAQLGGTCGYKLEYLGWLARQGRIDAIKRGGRWYSTRGAIEQYKAEAEEGIHKRGRPPSRSL